MDVMFDSDSDEKTEEDKIYNEEDSEHSELPVDVFEITTLSFSLKQLTYRTKETRKTSCRGPSSTYNTKT